MVTGHEYGVEGVYTGNWDKIQVQCRILYPRLFTSKGKARYRYGSPDDKT